MKIAQIKQLDVGMAGIKTDGHIGFCGVPNNVTGEKAGKAYDFWSQFVTIVDNTDEIGASIIIDSPEQQLKKGDQIFIDKSTLVSYQKDNKTNLKLQTSQWSQNTQQQVPQRPPQAPQQPAGQQNAPKEVDWDAKECRSHRAMCMAYAKDLVMAGKLSIDEMNGWVKAKVTFIWDGLTDRGGQAPEKRYQGGSPVPQSERNELDEYLD